MWSWHVVHAIRYHTIGSYIACKIALAVPDDLFPLTHTFSAILKQLYFEGKTHENQMHAKCRPQNSSSHSKTY
jgi:hypothetical protein